MIHCLALEEDSPSHAWLPQIKVAFEWFGFAIDKQLRLSFHGSMKVHISQIGHKDMKGVLKHLAAHGAYIRAVDAHRKDFNAPQGILDLDLTQHHYKRKLSGGDGVIPDYSYFENQLVGCSMTMDRLAAAKMVQEATCRFCGEEKESLVHIVHDCSKVHETFSKPPDHEFGPNFCTLGIVEHPVAIAKHRLRMSALPEASLLEHFDLAGRQKLWTDGSILWGDCFWLTCGGCAIINEWEEKVFATTVQHWALKWPLFPGGLLFGNNGKTVVNLCRSLSRLHGSHRILLMVFLLS